MSSEPIKIGGYTLGGTEDISGVLKFLRGAKLEIDKKIRELEKNNPACPICKQRYSKDKYIIREEKSDSRWNRVYITCPHGDEVDFVVVGGVDEEYKDKIFDCFEDYGMMD